MCSLSLLLVDGNFLDMCGFEETHLDDLGSSQGILEILIVYTLPPFLPPAWKSVSGSRCWDKSENGEYKIKMFILPRDYSYEEI